MDQKNRLKACVVGAGFAGPAHVEAIRRNGVEVVAMVADGIDEAKRKADELNIPSYYGSLDEALESSGADVYHLAVPNALHAPYARAVLAAKKHVICEKPLALSSVESAALVAQAKASGVVAAVSYNLRFYPLVREARERIKAGAIGAIHAAHGSYLQDWLLYDTDWNWRIDPERGGALRAVADIGTHWLDMVSWVTGLKISSVFADFSTVHPVRWRPKGEVQTFTGSPPTSGSGNLEDVKITTEDQAAILLRFDNGARGSLFVSQVCAGRRNSLTFGIDGSKGSLSWDSEKPNELFSGHRDKANEMIDKSPALLSSAARNLCAYPGGHQEGYPDTFRQLFASVYAYIQRGDFSAPRDFPTFEDGHREMQYCDALLKSARTGQWITV